MEKYLHKAVCLIFLLLSLVKFTYAQKSDTSLIRLNVAVTGSYQEGNFQRLQLINRADFSVNNKNRKWEFLTRHLYLYQTVFGNKTQDDYLTRNFLTYRITSRWDVFGAFFTEKFLIKRIDLHTQYGVGTRLAVVKTPRAFIQLGLMGSYSDKRYAAPNFTDFDNEGSNTITAFFVTPVLNMRFVVIPKALIISFLGWYQQDIVITQNWRYVLDGALIAPVWKGVSLRVSVNNFYENINLVQVKPNDVFITYGLNIQLHK